MLHVQLLGTGWDVQKWEMWGWGSVFSSVAKQRAKLRAELGSRVHRAGSAVLPERADCIAHQQCSDTWGASRSKQTAAAVWLEG